MFIYWFCVIKAYFVTSLNSFVKVLVFFHWFCVIKVVISYFVTSLISFWKVLVFIGSVSSKLCYGWNFFVSCDEGSSIAHCRRLIPLPCCHPKIFASPHIQIFDIRLYTIWRAKLIHLVLGQPCI